MPMVLRPALAQWFCEVVCVATAVVGPTMVTPEGRGGLGDDGTIWSYFLVYLRRCGGVAFATGGLEQHGDTPQ